MGGARIHSIGIIGGGNMGEALLVGILKNRLIPKNHLIVSEALPSRRRELKNRYAISVTQDNRKLVSQSHIVILAVKPQQMEEVLHEIAPLGGKLVISIAAGIRLSFLARVLGKVPMIRVMPNLAAAVGEAISAMAKGSYATKEHCGIAERIFQAVGETVWIEEKKLDAITAVSGSGPAYVAALLKALCDGACQLGLSRNLSYRLIQKTFQGSIAYLVRKGIDPERFIQKVASKGGTTEAALEVFRSRRLSQTMALALRRAAERSRQLSRG